MTFDAVVMPAQKPASDGLRSTKTSKQCRKISNRKIDTSSPTTAEPVATKLALRKRKTRIFKHFNKIPIELRLKIWQYAALSPRLIAAKWKTESNEIRLQSFYELRAGRVPAVLQINQESRKVALRIFT